MRSYFQITQMKRTLALLALAALVCLAQPPALSPDQKLTHALNRLTFGARPGDVERVRAMGLTQWLEEQLHPEAIVENPELEKRLAPLDTLRMSTAEMLRHYPSRQVVKAISEGRAELPTDPFTRAVFEVAAKRIKKVEAKTPQADDKPLPALPADMPARPRERVTWLEALPTEKLVPALEAIPLGQRRRLADLAGPDLRRKIEVLSAPMQVIPTDLVSGKILRATWSNKQLEEVLVDFWYNHFNVFLEKGADRELVTSYERDAIRPHVLGKFKDLLVATAQSPAMLFYLDNWQSSGPEAPARGGKQNRGLNENYGRELLELHTLGVDGGYAQQDVTEVARCFTGWTLRRPTQGHGFFFNPRMHDRGVKHVLGKTVEPNGMAEGLQVLDILAHHPSTAHFIATKLAMRFVADDPPASVVTQMEKTFLSTDGDLREVMRAMLTSPEFWDPARLNGKLKSPLEFLVSALRASGDEVKNPTSLNTVLTKMGQPLYRKAEPTGYSNRGEDWMNSSSLLARMNFATSLKHPEYGAPDFQRK